MVLGLPSRTPGRGGAVVSCLTSEYSGASFWGGSSQLQFPHLHLFARWTPIPESERAREREEAFFPFEGLEPGTCFSKNVDHQGPGYLFNSVIFIPLLQKACYMFRNKSVWFAKSRLSCDPLK